MKNVWMTVAGLAWVVAGCSGDACVGVRLPDGGCGTAPVDSGSPGEDSGVTLCASDRECSDDRFCTGIERCDPAAATDPSGCIPGEPPCAMSGVTCGEAAARCVTDCGTSADADHDGHASTDCGGDDCDDTRGDVFAGAVEACDPEGINEDCVPATLGPDRDGDGFPSEGCCYLAAGAVDLACGGDCADDDPARSPDASEICNAIDDDCDGNVDEGLPSAAFYADADGDGYGTGEPQVLCGPDATYTAPRGGDCADDDTTVNPGEAELCNGRDDDCDPATWGDGEDDDGDGYPDAECGGDDCYDESATAGPDVCDVTDIVAGREHMCALHASGLVHCWGSNSSGQLGDGTTTGHSSPVLVSGLSDAMNVSAGWLFTCAARADRSIACWGSNRNAELGIGTTGGSFSTPQRAMYTPSSAAPILYSGDAHTCALVGSRVYCWGRNDSGQCGQPVAESLRVLTPTRMTPAPPVAVLSTAGGAHTCGHSLPWGRGSCWGNNTDGQLGDNTLTSRYVSAGIQPNGYIYDQLIAGVNFTCGRVDAQAMCWGDNARGQLGTGDNIGRLFPDLTSGRVTGLATIASLSDSAGYHVCAVLTSGQVWCWGENGRMQLGDGSTTDRNAAVRVRDLPSSAVRAATSEHQSCALMSTGAVWCWGRHEVPAPLWE